LSHSSSSKSITTNALLDNGSQETFIKGDLLNELNIRGVGTSISITTIAGEISEPSIAVDGLQITNMNQSARISLPRTYSQKLLPVEVDEIPIPKKLRRWSYLDRIHPFIPQDVKDVKDVKIKLLIGGNCPRALEPLEIIPSKGGGPYAFRSKLGWCVTGSHPIECFDLHEMSSHCNQGCHVKLPITKQQRASANSNQKFKEKVYEKPKGAVRLYHVHQWNVGKRTCSRS